jgi:hypothetical protein
MKKTILDIEEEQTTQWPKEKVQRNKQRSTKHTYKTKYRVTRTPLKLSSKIYIINNWGLMKKTILDEVVFILFLSYSEHRELYSNIGMQHTVGSA